MSFDFPKRAKWRFSRASRIQDTHFFIEIWLLLHYHNNNKNWPCTFILIVLVSDDLSAPKCIPISVCLFCYIKLFFTLNFYINLCICSGVLKWRFTFFLFLLTCTCVSIYMCTYFPSSKLSVCSKKKLCINFRSRYFIFIK